MFSSSADNSGGGGGACPDCKCVAKADELLDTRATTLPVWDPDAVTCRDDNSKDAWLNKQPCSKLASLGWCADTAT